MVCRCVAIIDDKVEMIYGKEIQHYFDHHVIKLTKLVYRVNTDTNLFIDC